MHLTAVRSRGIALCFVAAAALCWLAPPGTAAEPLRAGVVGCDTSHVIAFTKLINDPAAAGSLADVQVVCAFPGGSPDLPASRDRVPGYTKQLQEMGVEIVDSIADVVERSDVLLLESLDGRVHRDQFRQLAVGKPVFIDKPAAASLRDVMAIFKLAEQSKTPCFTSSALRFSDKVVAAKTNPSLGELAGCAVASPFQTEPHHPDLFWYGVHGVESVYTLMGVGCESVARIEGEHETIVTGRWSDGRLAVYRGLKGHSDYVFTAYGSKGVAFERGFSGYQPLVREVCDFFVSHKPPVSAAETIEMFAFMEAADESLRREGRVIEIKEIMARAERELAQEPATSK